MENRLSSLAGLKRCKDTNAGMISDIPAGVEELLLGKGCDVIP